MFKKILVLFISLAATIYFIFFSNLSVNLIDQSTTYNIDFIFNENFPQLRTHELILGFRSDNTDNIQPYQKIYHYTQVRNKVSFNFNTREKYLKALDLTFVHLSSDFPQSVSLQSIAINGQKQSFSQSFPQKCLKKELDENTASVDKNLITIKTETSEEHDNEQCYNKISIVLDQNFYPENTGLDINLEKVNVFRMIVTAIVIFTLLTLLQIFLIKLFSIKKLVVYFNVHDLIIIFTLYVFNALIVLFFVRDFEDAVSVNLSCLFVSILEFTGFYALTLLFARKKVLFITAAGIWMIIIIGQLMCLINSLSYISLVSAGNINLDNLSVLFNEYNFKFPTLFALALALLISIQSKPKKEITLKKYQAKLFLLLSVSFLSCSFLLNTLANGTRIEHFQSPVLEWAKTNIIRLFPESISYISPITPTYLTQYPENNFNSKETFYNDTVYEKELPYPLKRPLNKPNVIIFFVESFTSEFIDSYRDEPLNLMPFMSNLQKNYPDKGITLVRNYFNHSATTIKNIRSQLISGFQYDSVIKTTLPDKNSITEILNNNNYVTYFLSPKTGECEFNQMLHKTGFKYPVYANMTKIGTDTFTKTDCKFADCEDDEMVTRLKDLIHYHKKNNSLNDKPYFISMYNIGTHLNQKGRLSYKDSNNIILNRNYTLDFDLSTLIQFYYSELAENTILILTADHAIIPGDYDSEIIDFDQNHIINEVPFYIFQPYYDLPKEIDLHEVGGYINSLATAPTLMHLLKINQPNYFLGCSFFEKKCRRAVNLSQYTWYIDDGIYLKTGEFENNKKYKPVEINNKLQIEYPNEDFRIYNQYRKAYINMFDQ